MKFITSERVHVMGKYSKYTRKEKIKLNPNTRDTMWTFSRVVKNNAKLSSIISIIEETKSIRTFIRGESLSSLHLSSLVKRKT